MILSGVNLPNRLATQLIDSGRAFIFVHSNTLVSFDLRSFLCSETLNFDPFFDKYIYIYVLLLFYQIKHAPTHLLMSELMF